MNEAPEAVNPIQPLIVVSILFSIPSFPADQTRAGTSEAMEPLTAAQEWRDTETVSDRMGDVGFSLCIESAIRISDFEDPPCGARVFG